MRVTVQLFARLRETAGRTDVDCDVPDGATIAEVWQAVVRQYPDLGAFGGSLSCARNEEFARMQTRAREGDVIAFLPPVSGGAGSS